MLNRRIDGAAHTRAHRDGGTLAAGKIADVVAVPGDPIADISPMQQVSFVMKDSVVYKWNPVPVALPP